MHKIQNAVKLSLNELKSAKISWELRSLKQWLMLLMLMHLVVVPLDQNSQKPVW